MTNNIKIIPTLSSEEQQILNPKTLALIELLHTKFNPRRLELLAQRLHRQDEIEDGKKPDFLKDTKSIRDGDWEVAPLPSDLQDRRVEITGPVDRKMVINALNAPVKTFMADFEDSCSPTWSNIVQGQINLRDAINGTIEFIRDSDQKRYSLNENTATLIVRPRGWHLNEKHILINGEEVSGSLFDFALYLSNNYQSLNSKGSGPYFYLPKLESHLEARLWNDVFVEAQDFLKIEQGTIKATVLIETILAAFEMNEILYELKDHSAGLNCGRWDYIFSFIKRFRNDPSCILPNRDEVTMTRHFLNSYVDELIKTCHKRNVHAMGGMAAQIPIKNDAEKNKLAMDKVQSDKLREAKAGHDGTWIAHPGLSTIAMDAFDSVMANNPNQISNKRNDVNTTAGDLLKIPTGSITQQGIRENIRVGVQYIEAWLSGNGCVPLYNLMEDAATAEISRSQIWQWIHHKVRISESEQVISEEYFVQSLEEEMDLIIAERDFDSEHLQTAIDLFKDMSISSEFDEFLTLPAYQHL
ncbi:MAG: malate synthase A [Gammaproteobacteria bacterium]|nr:malate synthase A [Gammaproteobacteria bacterium]